MKLKQVVDNLTLVNETLIDTYLSRARPGALDRDTLVGWLNEEKWLSAVESQKIFSDTTIEESYKVAACFTDKARFKNFKHLPSDLAAAHSAVQDNELLWLKRQRLNLL